MRQLNATYIGGPTALFDWEGVRFLTDPTFDPPGGKYTTGPVTLEKTMGPAVGVESLGRVDLVWVSHDHHFDNLDHAGRAFLQRASRVITTAEGAERLGGSAYGLVSWQSVDISQADGRTLRITATPAQHGPADLHRGAVIGFVATFIDEPDDAIYFSGDTVWFEGIEEVAQRFKIKTAILNLGAARVPAVGPFFLTMTAEEAVHCTQVFPDATIVPLHYEGWTHFTESRAIIAQVFQAAGVSDRIRWLTAGQTESLR